MEKIGFIPNKFIKGGFFQTVFPFYFNENPKDFSPEETVFVPFSDGDKGLIDFNGLNSVSEKPIVFLAHGLGGCTESPYKKRLAKKLVDNGFMTARFAHRGSNSDKLRSRKTYHSGSYGDLKAAINYVEKRWPDRKILVIGYSLSGTIMMNMLIRSGKDEFKQVKKFVSVCAPVDLKKSSEYVKEGLNRMFDIYYSFELKKILRKQKQDNPQSQYPSLNGVYSVFDFDAAFTASHAGYKNVDDYYADCSPLKRLSEIKHHIEMIFAKDDPLISEACLDRIPRDIETLELNIQNSGGHLGFYSENNTSFNDKRWLDEYLYKVASNIT